MFINRPPSVLSRQRTHPRIVLLVLLGLALSACQPIQPPAGASDQPAVQTTDAAIPEVIIKGHDFSFEAPDNLEAGAVTLVLENAGHEIHHAQLARLNEGVTLEQLMGAMQQSQEAVFGMVTFVGGPGAVAPMQTARVTLQLDAGMHILLCFIAGDDGVPHLAKGMLQPLEVMPATAGAEVALPEADVTVNMTDFAFHHALPEITAGRQVWKVVNEGEQPHELALIKLAPGKTMDDVAAFFAGPQGPPPFESMGGMQGLSKGFEGYLHLDLTPGDYVALCHIPDPASGKPHTELGMVMPFMVH